MVDEKIIESMKLAVRKKPRSVRLNLDPDIFELYKVQGKGHMTLMQDVLTEYAKRKLQHN